MYRFVHLPGLAALIRDRFLPAFSQGQYDMSVRLQLPLLQHFSEYKMDEIMAITTRAALEFLEALIANEAYEHIGLSAQRWEHNELPVLQDFDVIVEDITVLNHVRGEGLRQFIPEYTADVRTAVELAGEIDRLFMGFNTTSMVQFIDMLRARISRRESQLLEAESIAHLGSFDWQMVKNRTESSPELQAILETDSPMPLAEFLNSVHPDDSDMLREAIAYAFANGSLQCEFRVETPRRQKILWARGVVHFENNEPVRMVGVIQDVTDRKKMEETLLHKTLELERSNEELQQFASVASHDLKEPLRKIVLYSGLLETASGASWSPEALLHLQRIKDSARRMRLLIEDILAFSSLNQQQQSQRVSLEKLLDEVREVLESRIRETGATITSDGLPEALVVPYQFRQLFQNLLSNSLKFMKPGIPPVITISHRLVEIPPQQRQSPANPGTFLELTFADNGIGFPARYSEKIFGLFNRLHSRNEFEGTGLGLAICRKVVENLGGRIEAESEAGQGATFRILIPQ
jgi:signal transduction histidine kinase